MAFDLFEKDYSIDQNATMGANRGFLDIAPLTTLSKWFIKINIMIFSFI